MPKVDINEIERIAWEQIKDPVKAAAVIVDLHQVLKTVEKKRGNLLSEKKKYALMVTPEEKSADG